MKIGAYVRVSSQQQAQSQTIEQQLERLKAHFQSQNWPWNEENVFRADGFSGASLKRPGLDRLRDKMALASFERLVITAPDRLARKYVHQMLLIEEFEKAGCTVEFLERPMSQDPHDQLLLQIRGAVAEYERTLITERMRRGRQQRYRTGQLLPWTLSPYGYRSKPDRPRDPAGVYLEEAEAAVVAEIFDYYAQESHTLGDLVRHLLAMGLKTPKGKERWGLMSLHAILTNPVYTGKVYAGRMRSVPTRKRMSPLRAVSPHRQSVEFNPPEEWILVGQVPAVVSKEQFELVQQKLAHNQKFSRRNNKSHQYLLRALVSCGLCGNSCLGCTRGQRSYYACRAKGRAIITNVDEKCRSRYLPSDQLDAVVWADLCEVIQKPDLITQALQRAQGGEWLPQELQARRENLRKAKANLSRQLERLTEAYLAGVILLEEYKRRREELEQRQ